MSGGRTGHSGSVWREIAVSWMSLKTWVKAWLFSLNAVFLGVLVFLPEPLVGWTMLAYVLAGVLLLGIMVPQRGLTRLLGLGHLIPWAPLLVYLVLRLSSDAAGSRIAPAADPGLFAYVLLLAGVVSVCLAFDLYDVLRWVRGERYVMGSAEAVEAGASRFAGR